MLLTKHRASTFHELSTASQNCEHCIIMASAILPIPRFLLPQLTWRSVGPISFLTARASTLGTSTQDRNLRQQHTISSQVKAWKKSKHSGVKVHSCNVLSHFTHSSRRPFHSSKALYRDHHFDTLKFVQRLKDEGVSEEQAKAMMRVLSDVIEESIQNLTRTMVLREGKSPLPLPLFYPYKGTGG